MLSKLRRTAGAVALASAFWLGSGGWASAQAPESTDPIKIALFDWTSVNLNAKILGGILEKLGYTVEYPTADLLTRKRKFHSSTQPPARHYCSEKVAVRSVCCIIQPGKYIYFPVAGKNCSLRIY